MVAPMGEVCTVRAVMSYGEPAPFARAGENVELRLSGIDHEKLAVGDVLCDPDAPIPAAKKFEAKIMTLKALKIPMLQGSQFTMHLQSVECPATVVKLLSATTAKGRERKNPRCIARNASGTIHVALQYPVCLETYEDLRPLGRFLLRTGGVTVAAGLVTDILDVRGYNGAGRK